MKTMNLLLATVASGGLAFGVVAYAGEHMAEAVDMKTLPAPVQKSITEHAGGGEIVQVEREDDPDGKWNYEVVVKSTGGKEWGFEINPSGKFVRKHANLAKR